MPKYVQFSSHDTQMANLWRFFNISQTEWPFVPYASQNFFALQADSLCIEQRLYHLRNILKPS